MSFGVTDQGFVGKTLDDIKAEVEADLKASFGQSIDLSPQSNFGQIVGVVSEQLADLWAQAQAEYSALSPDAATGAQLDNVAAITGTVRKAAKSSTVTLTATGTAGTVLPTGRVASVSGTGVRFATTAPGTLAAVPAWAPTTLYIAGTRVKNGTTSRVYQAKTTGTSAGSGGPTSTASNIVDGSVAWEYLGDGAAAVDIPAASEDTGAKIAASGTLTVIETPVSGWSGVYNVLDADLGNDIESDAALRLRRESELRGNGNAAADAIRTAVLDVATVTACTIFENTTDATDANGVPPHAIEALVQGGVDADVAAAIFGSVAAGIATSGGVSASVTDSQGTAHTINFSRPTQKNIYVALSLTIDSTAYPSDGDSEVKEAIVEYGDLQPTGKDVVATALIAQCFKVAGVLDVVCYIGLAPSPVSSATIAISLRELAVFDTSRITVTTTPGTP